MANPTLARSTAVTARDGPPLLPAMEPGPITDEERVQGYDQTPYSGEHQPRARVPGRRRLPGVDASGLASALQVRPSTHSQVIGGMASAVASQLLANL